ncbi:MAG TPA: helicase C-terminal domain-containing protein, partial [Gemmatimonadaceae bacterium]
LQLRREEDGPWARVSAAEGGCMTMQCPYVRDGSCFLYRAKKRADAAHLLIVNHALLLSDVVAGGNVLPEYKHLVVDEAHHLEQQATQQFGFSASEANLLDWLDRLSVRVAKDREGGLSGTVINATRVSMQAVGAGPQLQALARTLAQTASRARTAVPPFWQALRSFAQQHANERGDFDDRLTINRGIRVQPDWADIESAWFDVEEKLTAVCGVVEELVDMLVQVNSADILDRDAVLAEANELLESGEYLKSGVSNIIGKDDKAAVCWLTMGRHEASPSLSSAPLNVAELLKAGLFNAKDSVVLTSATLTTDESFGYIKERLGCEDARELSLGSPFDYRTSTLMLSPTDMPEPENQGYAAAVQSALIDLVQASEGRALVLFTSHAALRTAYNGIKRPLEEQQILVLGQGIDGAPKHLLATLKDSQRVVVLGAASFWEGVDVTGEALSLLVIARLPFPVPSDPVFQARSELFEQPFERYAVPQAILRFKQGFGRLIRSRTDRGVMVVLDRRLRSRRYGDSFIRSLPECTLRDVLLRDMPGEVSSWLARPGARVAP